MTVMLWEREGRARVLRAASNNRKVFRKGGGDEVNLPGKFLVCGGG